MAIDRWLFDQCHRGLLPPTLRFYTWTPTAISLGRNQRHWPDHWQYLTWRDKPIDLVRRPTGGRAVLHEGELTYAIALTLPNRDRRQAYQDLCQFLIQGWQVLGVNLHFGQAHRSDTRRANCFSTATNADLVLDSGYKLIGSAQAWQDQTVLQHGSMRLRPDQKLASQVFGVSPPDHQSVPADIPNLSESEIITALIRAAEGCLSAPFDYQSLSPAEWEAIQKIAESQSLNAPLAKARSQT